MRIFLSGPMGSGKSTVGKAVAERAGVPFWDLDALVVQRAGMSIPQLFAQRGEPAFRELERAALRELIAQQATGVIALGGGTVIDVALRRELLLQGTLVTLAADPVELARRVGDGSGRPLLAGQDVAARLHAVLDARADAYAECHATLETAGHAVEALAGAVLALANDVSVVVPLGRRSYRVEIGPGVRERLPARVAAMAKSPRIAFVSDERVAPLWGDPLAAALQHSGKQLARVTLGAGEAHKTLRSVEQIWEAALALGVDRGGGVVGVGGGVVGDLSGFAASALLRGVPVGHVPTTLLAMVDSAIGGKTGFDTAHGKNLVGAFHQPSFVLCDIECLTTLPALERAAGLAEVVKSAWIDGEAAVAQLERDRAALAAGEPEATVRAIRMAAALKTRIVTEDERESGQRALLNLGHTVGHAIEAFQGYGGLLHGQAVALGMVAAFQVAVRMGELEREQLDRLVALLAELGLPTEAHAYLRPEVLSFIAADKKRRADRITFVLPGNPGHVRLLPLPMAEFERLLLSERAGESR